MGVLGGTLNQLGGGFSSLGSVVSGFAGAGVLGAATAALGEVIKGFQWSVKEAGESEQAIKNLSIAVEKSGTSWESVKEGTNAALSELQKFTVYSDEQLAGALQRLLTFGMSYEEAMKALGVTVDLAAAKQMDLESAANLVGKTFTGNTAILKRYGIDIQTGKEATAAMKKAIEALTDALKSLGSDALDPFADVLAEAGIVLTDSEGKFRDVKDVAEDLIGAFLSGAIDAETFAEITKALGIEIDAAGLEAADFEEIMVALNEQFGGTAQEQAKTYTGVQERFKNAMSDLGEKIGGIVLPALSLFMEAMIEVVDGIGEGIEALQDWITEFANIPEVKEILIIVQQSFAGLSLAISEATQGLVEFLRKVAETETVQEAVSEIRESFRGITEILQEIDAELRKIIERLGVELPESVTAVQFVAQVLANVLEMLILTPLRQLEFLLTLFRDLLEAIRIWMGAIEDFFNWLVGGSIWQDLFDRMFEIAQEGFTRIKELFTGAVAEIQGTLEPALAAQVTAWETWTQNVTAALDTFWAAMNEKFTTALTELQTLWDTKWKEISTIVENTTKSIQENLAKFWQEAQQKCQQALQQLHQGFQQGLQSIQQSFQQAFQQMLQTATQILQQIIQAVQQALQAVMQAASQMASMMVGHSIWPDMLLKMEIQAEDALARIASAFEETFKQVPSSLAEEPGRITVAERSRRLHAPAYAGPSTVRTELTIPISVTLEGQEIMRLVKKVLAEERVYRERTYQAVA